MRRSLYWKFVVTFITGVIISLLASYFITSLFFQEDIIFERELEQASSYAEDLLRIIDTEDLPQLLNLFREFGIDAVVLNQDDEPILSEMDPSFISEEMIDEVKTLQGKEVVSFVPSRRGTVRYIGTSLNGEHDAQTLFLKIDVSNELADTRQLTMHVLLLVLLIGSLFIILISRYFVGSIRSVTKASEQLATGDFSVRLQTERQDEVGRLMRSFNDLAQALGNMDEVRESFVSNVSHEIQSPLTSIKGYARAIQDGLIPIEDQAEYIAVIYREADRLSRLSNSLLKMASLDAEEHLIKLEHYRLDEQIRRVTLSTEPFWREKNITFDLDLTKIYIYADQDLLEQAWLNLITNAIKYNRENGEIHISFYKDEEYHIIRINDTGIGISQSSIPYLFDRFYKEDQSRSEFSGGNGLGLSITKKIILLHGGTIDVVSEKGVGTTFFVRLPIR
ncbi:HAMP domain-containing histidine kinase [Amphibacillus sp. MSJ-3]|uniref:sensor histidine kinase n=1 Tax=Amphibacillus sp. MSJ-3 TaxID=2841505 RepID=UPI001C0F0CA1|nr:HAMP domain-containing sensor histidine kinase [Amphibacillus sp. MSJ-3]MBU5593940.1 HAMP domain-containing histidine kinase [Amphibacillus sp. MSJ-3]